MGPQQSPAARRSSTRPAEEEVEPLAKGAAGALQLVGLFLVLRPSGSTDKRGARVSIPRLAREERVGLSSFV